MLYVFKTFVKTADFECSRIKSYPICLRERLCECATFHIARVYNRTYETGINFLFRLFNVRSTCVRVLQVAVQLYQNNYIKLLFLSLKLKDNYIRTINVNTAFSFSNFIKNCSSSHEANKLPRILILRVLN